MKIRTSHLVLYALLAQIGLILLLGAAGLALLTDYRGGMQRAYDSLRLRTELADVMRDVVRERSTRLHRIVLLDATPERDREIDRYSALETRFQQAQIRLGGLLSDQEDLRSFADMVKLSEHGWRMQRSVIELVLDGETQAARDALMNTVLPVQDEVLERVGVFNALQRLQGERLANRFRDQYVNSVLLGTLIALVILALASAITILVRQRAAQAEASAEDYARQLQAHAGQLEDLVAVRTQDLSAARDEAVSANQAKSRFLANISHELRTPLSAIIGYSEMMEEEALDRRDRQSAADLRKIQAPARALLELINSILDLSRVEAGHMPVITETVDLSLLIEEVLDNVRPLAEKNAVDVRTDIEKGLERVETDVAKLKQILINLIANACKFTERGEVSIRIRILSPAGWCIEVADTGVGMDPEQLSRVFEPFVQADVSTTRRFGGTGLGLTLARNYAELLGGALSAESTPGIGSRFTVRLPGPPRPTQTPSA
jgi:signal transduction histidine kinase